MTIIPETVCDDGVERAVIQEERAALVQRDAAREAASADDDAYFKARGYGEHFRERPALAYEFWPSDVPEGKVIVVMSFRTRWSSYRSYLANDDHINNVREAIMAPWITAARER